MDLEPIPSVVFPVPEVGEHVSHPVGSGQEDELCFLAKRCHRRLCRRVDLLGTVEERGLV